MHIYAWFSSLNYPSQGNPLWISLLSALLTPTVAVIAAMIGYAQWRTARNQWITAEKKRKMDLFNVKYALYKRIENQLFIASTNRETVNRLDFIRTMDEMPFVFNSWVEDFRAQCLAAFYASQSMNPNAGTPQEGMQRLAKAYANLLHTFYEDMHIN